MIGTTLSHYDITAELGRGGMGIVYKARDTKLDREVAIKILPSAALASADDRERFYREAKSAAQLHHPNIASVFEIDEAVPEGGDAAEPRPFIAMEYIAGGTLQDRIKEAPLSLSDAVKIASQVAEALKAAHAKDIVHRDIKSANVMITEDGVAKVLDFGLAKTNQSTMLTRMGSTLGTVAYMSPEQARGQEVDGRTDLYSLGTMLYEMVAGRLPFAGEYEQAVVYSILNEPPEPLTSLRTGVPMQLEWIVNKLLAKDADYRYQSAADLLADLKSLDLSGSGMSRRSMPAMSATAVPGADSVQKKSKPAWAGPALVAAVALLVALGTWFLKPSPEVDTGPTIRTKIDLGPDVSSTAGVAVSRSGRLLAVSEEFAQLRIFNLETGENWLIPDGGRTASLEFSRDEAWLLLERPGSIDRVQVRGSRPVEFHNGRSQWAAPAWTPDQGVIFEDQGTLMVKSLSGGEPRIFAARDSLIGYDYPSLSEDGRYVLATAFQLEQNVEKIAVFSYPDGELLGMLDASGEYPKYVDTGHVLYESENSIMAVAADLDPPQLLGAPVPLFEDASTWRMSWTDHGHMFLGYGFVGSANRSIAFFVDQLDGNLRSTPVPVGSYDSFSIAPTLPLRAAVEVSAEEGGESLWVFNLETGGTNRLTFGDVGDNPWWHPSGDSVLYVDRSGPTSKLVLQAADGSGLIRVLHESDDRLGYPSANADFSTISFSVIPEESDVWLLDVASGQVSPLIQENGWQDQSRISPNGRFVAFEGNQVAGIFGVFIQSVDGPARHDISRGEGFDPVWSPDGRFIYFETREGTKQVEISTSGGRVSISNPVIIDPENRRDIFPLPDGSGLVISDEVDSAGMEGGGSSSSRFIEVRFNWKKELERLVPRSDGR